MNKMIVFIAVIVCVCCVNANSYALSGGVACLQRYCSVGYTIDLSGTNCATSNITCYGDGTMGVKTCLTCNSGYKLKSTSGTLIASNGGMCNVTYNTCESSGGTIDPDPGDDCDGTCENCESTDWEGVYNGLVSVKGYQQKITASCNTETCLCLKSTSYRCAGGYYGPSANCMKNLISGTTTCSGCTICPTSDSGVTGTSLPGSSDITNCRVSRGSDATGSYTYFPPCYYKE